MTRRDRRSGNLELVCLAMLMFAGCSYAAKVGSSDPGDAGTADAGPVCPYVLDCAQSSCEGRCCGPSCSQDPECGATACTSAGSCIYPSGSPCGPTSCDPVTNQVTAGTCSRGTCIFGTQACPDHFACAEGGVCHTNCSQTSDCQADSYCSDGQCLPEGRPGDRCTSDAGCASANCGVGDPDSGVARCCDFGQDCGSGDDAGCGTTGCDGRGACIYPSNVTHCSEPTCTGNHYTLPAYCDGLGHCLAQTDLSCGAFACGPDAGCLTSCGSDVDCFNGFCDRPSQQCCAVFAGETIYVDGTQGSRDNPCCGATPGPGACLLLADAMRLVAESRVSGFIINVAGLTSESTVVQVSYDVIIKAPGAELPSLVVRPFPGDPSTSVVVEGAAGNPALGANTGSVPVPQIEVDPPMTLYLLNTSLNGHNGRPVVQVNAGAHLKLGSDGASTSGTASITAVQGPLSSGTGIACAGLPGAPATIDDLSSTALPSVQIEDTYIDLDIGDFCTVNLVGHPVFGAPECGASDLQDQTGLLVDGAANVTISNALFQCFSRQAILMQSSGGLGSPTVTGNSNTIERSAVGVQCQAGTFSMTGTTITQNGNGVIQADDSVYQTTGTVDLSGGGNQVYCNSGTVPLPQLSVVLAPGVDVLNLTADAGLDARDVAWDGWDSDAGHTERWSCDPSLTVCTCSGSGSCASRASLEADADAVTTNGIPVDDTGGSLVAVGVGGACP